MSDPTPERFHNFWWTIGDVMGWLADGGDRAKFGRIATVADLSPPIFEDDPEARERRPEILLLRALQQGLIAHDPRTGPIAPEIWLPSMNEGDIRELFRRGASFKHGDVLLWREATTPSLAGTEGELSQETEAAGAPQSPASVVGSPKEPHVAPGPSGEASPFTASYADVKKAVEKRGSATERELCKTAHEALPGKRVPRKWVRKARDELFGRPGRIGRPKSSKKSPQ